MTYIFRNNTNTNTYASMPAENPADNGTYSNIVGPGSTKGLIDFKGKTSSDACYFKNARLMPLESTNSSASASISCDLTEYNNFHISTSATIGTINLTNPIVGQSGHIVITNTSANTHSITWQLAGNSSYMKWPAATAPTMTATSGATDVISYYVLSTSCIIVCSTLNH